MMRSIDTARRVLPALEFLIVAVILTGSALAGEPVRPNILFVLADDLGARDTACYGSEVYRTPAIDRLAAEGARFTQAYAAHPRCVPSRYAIQTGRYPARAGIPARHHNMSANERTLAEALRDGGYATFFCGKWHLEGTRDEAPGAQGYEIAIAGGKTGATASHFAPYNQSRNPHHKTEGAIPDLDDAPEGEYLTDRLTDETLRFIRDHVADRPDQPFFAFLSHYAVHTPIEAKPEVAAQYRDRIAAMDFPGEPYVDIDGTTKMHQDNPVYAAMIDSLDENLGRLLDALAELGIATNTVVVFTSDHGGLSNRGVDNQRELATSNLPLRAGKGHLYEGGVRVPLIVRWPERIPAGLTTTEITTGTDHFPALLELAGLPAEPEAALDGWSYAALLRGESAVRPDPVFWHSPRPRPKNTGDRNCTAMRQGEQKLLYFPDDQTHELYDLATDPGEQTNRIGLDPSRDKVLIDELHGWMRRTAPRE